MRYARRLQVTGYPLGLEDSRWTIYPWDLRSWRRALEIAGLPGFALLAVLLGTIAQFADPGNVGPAHSSPAVILFIRGPLAVIALLLLLFRPRFAKVGLRDTRSAYLAFGLLYLVSILWSPEPAQTLGKALEILLAGLVFLEVSLSPNALERVDALRRLTLLTISLTACVTVVGYLLHISAFVQQRPGLFTSTTAQAPFLSGNGLGYVASALLLVIFAEWQAKRISRTSAMRQMFFGFAVFSLAASRTSFVILALTVLLVIFRRSKVTAILSALTLGAIVLVARQLLLQRLQGHQSGEGFTTLSGRTVLWTAALRQWGDQPILGAGGGVGGKAVIAHIGDIYLQQVSSLHNGFLELLLGLGTIGFIIGIYLVATVSWRAWKEWYVHPEYSGTYVLIVHAWLTTIMSTGVLGWFGYEMAFFLCIMTNVDLLRRRALAHQVQLSRYTPQRRAALELATD